jgi:hypothetical protein
MHHRVNRAETDMTDNSDPSFFTRPGKPKFDWELVLAQIEGSYRQAPDNRHRLQIHGSMLKQLAFERDAYRDDLMAIARTAQVEMNVIWADDPEKDRIFAVHWSRWREECRSRMAWLGECEKRLDDAYVAAVQII